MPDALTHDLAALRLRLSKMPDTVLKAYGRSLIQQCRPEQRRAGTLSESELLLIEIQLEWRRRHPTKQKSASIARYVR
jgi:hypothetical protein